MPAELLKQLLDQTGLRQLLAKQPQRRAVGNAIFDAKRQETRERQAVARLILDLLVRQIVERLHNKHPEHHERIHRLAAGAALFVVIRRQHHGLNLVAKILPRYKPRDRLQRITLLGERREPIVYIEKTELRHRPFPP